MITLSLSKLNTYIRRAIGINFQEPVWITAEILNSNTKSGHTYLELAEKDDSNSIIAQASAVLWKNQRHYLQDTNTVDLDQLLKPGLEIRICVKVDFHIRYGLKLVIDQLDAQFSLGKIAQNRQKTIAKLIEEQLWQKNKQIELPMVVQKVALFASASTAAYADFIDQLYSNPFGYQFHVELFDVTVQGDAATRSLIDAFVKITKRTSDFDVVVLIRGGGSKHDLFDFDSFEVSQAISLCGIPVLTGIGHHVDESIADLSAHTALKTPTAVAEFILHQNLSFENRIKENCQEMIRYSRELITANLFTLKQVQHNIQSTGNLQVLQSKHALSEWKNQLVLTSRLLVAMQKSSLQDCMHVLESNDPEYILSKGYSLTYANGALVSSGSQFSRGDILISHFNFGDIKSIIDSEWPEKK